MGVGVCVQDIGHAHVENILVSHGWGATQMRGCNMVAYNAYIRMQKIILVQYGWVQHGDFANRGCMAGHGTSWPGCHFSKIDFYHIVLLP